MPLLEQLVRNLENYKYYSGKGTFNANNLPYGQDTPGGGSSKQPFIVRNVDQRWSPSNFDDGLTPFGAVTLATRTAADLTRVTQFLYTTVKGPLFLIKQTGLQRTNPNIRQTDVDSLEKKIAPTQIYNPLGLNTLAQVAFGPLGAKLTKHGIAPETESARNYENYMLQKDKDVNGGTRLTKLLTKLTNPDVDVLYEYRGGPEAVFGIGKTRIKRYAYSTSYNKVDDNFIPIPIKNLQTIGSDVRDEYGKLLVTNSRRILLDPTKNTSGDISKKDYILGSNFDFREYKNDLTPIDIVKQPFSNYKKYNLEDRIGVARVRTTSQRRSYMQSADTSDRINKIGLYYSNLPAPLEGSIKDVNDEDVTSPGIRDIIKFRIKVYDNDRALDPKGTSYGVYILFRAYISNIKRTVTPKWDAYKYVGRGESFYAYDGFTETMNISFVIAASSRDEMKPLYQKLNYLISSLAPDYSKAGLMRGNISELTIGDFLLYQPGIITSFDMIIDEDSNWEIALQEPESNVGQPDADMHELPQLIKCSMTFIPIYNFLPRKDAAAPFIGINGFGEPKSGKKWLENINKNLK